MIKKWIYEKGIRKNMQERKDVRNQKYIITNCTTNEQIELVPKAVESCMQPGTFHITPIIYQENDDEINFSLGDEVICISKEDMRSGKVSVDTQTFIPQVIRQEGGCKPCTNCGRCSW